MKSMDKSTSFFMSTAVLNGPHWKLYISPNVIQVRSSRYTLFSVSGVTIVMLRLLTPV